MAVADSWHNSSGPVWSRYWWLFGVALLLLLWVDLATTLAAADLYGLGAEANPIMRWLLGYHIAVVVLVHLAIFLTAMLGFALVSQIGQSLEGSRAMWYRRACGIWICSMIVLGMGVSLNNLVLVLIAL